MTCRPLLWIAAAAVAVGATTSSPVISAAEPGSGGTIAVDELATGVSDSKHLIITGTAANQGGAPDGVIVTVTPQGLPLQCGAASGPATLDGDRFAIELDVDCNGPHEIQAVAHDAQGSTSSEPLTIGVAEPPPEPAPPDLDVTAEGGLKATWEPTNDPDAAGSILHINFREDHYAAGIVEATLPPADRRASVARRALRWGADGPGTTVSSPESGWKVIGNAPLEPKPEPESPPTEPDPEPPVVTPHPTPGRANTTGPTPNPIDPGTPATSTTSTTLPPATAPAGAPRPELATVTALAPVWEPAGLFASDHSGRAAPTAAPEGGLVRITEKRPPGLVGLVGMGLVAICIAACIAFVIRRSPPTNP
jgi:hypothetical protein